MSSPVLGERRGNVLVVRLANPAGRNAIDLAFAQALHTVLGGDLAGVGAVALLAEGDHFCVGGDVRAMAAADDRPAMILELADELHRSMLLLPSLPPVVVGVRGWAAGAGMSLVCACDVVVAGRSAAFRAAYPGIGVTPDGGMSWNLPRIVGERRARSLIVRNAPLTAVEAVAAGLVDELVDDADVESRTLAVAAELAGGPTAALVAAKGLVAASSTRSYAEQLAAEAAGISACAGSPDGVEGIDAFVERRTPTFG